MITAISKTTKANKQMRSSRMMKVNQPKLKTLGEAYKQAFASRRNHFSPEASFF